MLLQLEASKVILIVCFLVYLTTRILLWALEINGMKRGVSSTKIILVSWSHIECLLETSNELQNFSREA
jgi:hypothetical protein